MGYSITRDRMRNRIYFTPPPGLDVPGARRDGERQWIGRADEPSGGLAAYLDRLVCQAESEAKSLEAYRAAVVAIPPDYGRRHGATLGGEWAIGSTRGVEPSIAAATPKLAWLKIAEHVTYYSEERDSSIAGRVDQSLTLYRAETGYGPVYREESRSYDDYRTTLWLPRALYEQQLDFEIERLGITPDIARKWLAESRGCVGTELYGYAAAQPLSC